MPDLPECTHSPFRVHPFFKGAALITGHRRYCDLINPDHPDYDPRIVRQYVVMSHQLMNLSDVGPDDTPGSQDPPGPQRPPGPPPTVVPGGDNRPPADWPDLKPHRHEMSGPSIMVADEELHQKVYREANDCLNRKQEFSCCGPVTRCGPGGSRAGQIVGIGQCYPCAMDRLGISTDGNEG